MKQTLEGWNEHENENENALFCWCVFWSKTGGWV